jgi:hypothetical protein
MPLSFSGDDDVDDDVVDDGNGANDVDTKAEYDGVVDAYDDDDEGAFVDGGGGGERRFDGGGDDVFSGHNRAFNDTTGAANDFVGGGANGDVFNANVTGVGIGFGIDGNGLSFRNAAAANAAADAAAAAAADADAVDANDVVAWQRRRARKALSARVAVFDKRYSNRTIQSLSASGMTPVTAALSTPNVTAAAAAAAAATRAARRRRQQALAAKESRCRWCECYCDFNMCSLLW